MWSSLGCRKRRPDADARGFFLFLSVRFICPLGHDHPGGPNVVSLELSLSQSPPTPPDGRRSSRTERPSSRCESRCCVCGRFRLCFDDSALRRRTLLLGTARQSRLVVSQRIGESRMWTFAVARSSERIAIAIICPYPPPAHPCLACRSRVRIMMLSAGLSTGASEGR